MFYVLEVRASGVEPDMQGTTCAALKTALPAVPLGPPTGGCVPAPWVANPGALRSRLFWMRASASLPNLEQDGIRSVPRSG